MSKCCSYARFLSRFWKECRVSLELGGGFSSCAHKVDGYLRVLEGESHYELKSCSSCLEMVSRVNAELNQFGVTRRSPELGSQWNPTWQEILRFDGGGNTICEVAQLGWFRGDDILLRAMVVLK